MDPRSPYLHHQNRYASQSQSQSQPQPQLQTQPRPHNNFHNLHASHHSPLPSPSSLPLRPPPPPPPTQFHLPPAAQPQYSPQNPSFGYNSNNNINYNNHHHRSHPEVSNFTQSPRVLHQKPFDDDLSRRLQDNRETRKSSRVLSDRWPPERPYSSSNLNPDPYRRQLGGNQAMSPMKLRHGVEGNSRFVEERNVNVVRQGGDEFLLRRGGGGDDNYHRRVQFGSNSERSSRDFRTVSNQMNHGSSSYENPRGSPYDDGVSESQRWAHNREVSADLRDSFIDKGNHEGGAPERIQMSTKRENYRSREANAELERHTGKGSREGSFEYNRTPRKQQPQKKSALLRLQKPNYRNREEERGQYYFDDSKSTSFRVKDQNLYPDRGMEERVREGSPVELDVSFKSNSLVAKAIVTPSSSSAAVSDSDSTPRSAKIRKVLFLNKDSSSSSLIRYSDQTEKLDGALSVANNASSSDTGLNQSKEEGTASGIGNLHDSTVPASSGSKVSHGKSKMESANKAMVSKKDGVNIASAKLSSVKVAKKKKIVKRVVKKVVHPNLSLSSLPTKKCDETAIPDSVDHGLPDSSEPEKDAAIVSTSAVNSQLCSNEILLMPENDKVEECDETAIPDSVDHGLPDSSEPEKDAAIVSASAVNSQLCSNEILLMPENDKVEEICKATAPENGADAGSHSLCVPIIKRKRSHITFPMGYSSHEATQNNEDKLNANSAACMRAISNADEDNKLPKETSSSYVDEIEDVDKQQYEHDDSLLLENNKVSRSPEVLLPSKCNADIDLSSLEKIENFQCQPSSYNMVLGYDTDRGSINSRKRVTVSEYGVMDAACKEHCMDQDSPPVEDGNLDEISNANSIGNSKMFKQTNSGDTEIQKVVTNPICSNEGARTMSGSDNGHSFSEERISFSHGVTNGKKPSPERVSMSIDDDSARGSLNFMVSTGVSEEDTSNSEMSEENVETSQVKLLKTGVNGSYLDPVNRIRPACWVDTTLRLSFKECASFSLDTAVQPCRDVGRVFPLESSTDVPEDSIAPPKQKHRKLSGSHLKLSCTMAPNVKERPINSEIPVSSAQAPSSSDGSPTGSEAEPREAVMDPLSISVFPLSENNNIASLANCAGGECHRTVASIQDVFDNDSVHLCSTSEEVAVPKVQSLYPSGLEAEQIADVTTVLAGSSHQVHSVYLESAEGEKMDVDAVDGRTIIDSGTGLCEFPSEIRSLKSDERLPAAEMENESCHHVKNDSSSVSKYLSSPRDGNGAPVTNSSIEVLGLVTDTLSDTDLSPNVPSTLDDQLLIEKSCRDDEILGKVSIQGGSNMSPLTSDPLDADVAINSDHALENAHLFSGKTRTLPLMGVKNSSQTLNATSGEKNGRIDQPTKVSRILGSSGLATSKNAASSSHLSKPRTWHRADKVPASAPPENKAVSTTVPKQRQLSRNVSKFQSTSYIRKGNSLVRKPTVGAAQSQGSHSSNSSIYRLNSLGTDEMKKTTGLDNRSFAAEPANFGRKTVNVSFETPRTPPLPAANKTSNHNSGPLGDRMASPVAEPVNNFAAETSGLVNVAESNDVLTSSGDAKVSENPTKEIGQINNFDGRNEPNDGNVASSNANSITYVKRKSNQLIAASSSYLSINNSIDTSVPPSDRYYKRRKNQLIRTSLESQAEQMASFPAGTINSDEPALHNGASSKSFTKRQLRKVVTKTRKPSKFSLVWTLRSSQLSNDNGNLVHRPKVWPHLFPWKRATYLKNSVPNVAASLINSSSSTMSRKLQLLRKRDTLYTRSKHGFSLRKSKVLSVGGSSLKWSKSIEKQSKKANEEATLAVAEAERKKREQSGASHFVSGNKNSRKAVHNIKLRTGGQIFCIGSIRYKMDSSRRTLQRVSDDDSSYPSARQTEKDAKTSYVPRRLVIGKDEYVRIGNGNQLVRDPKRRTRILASEKVRWSLHTARSRLARRRKYCQFFTRFGKCNKDDGKCPYIHDSSKIAVCTKFLKGLCFNVDCKLTHKVIPERMPDCSYFLQGICSNKHCPYRHVHVNPNASTCEGFLRGYCADGDECRKKHSYVCPAYEATGSCPQGSKCKLHHPQNRRKGNKSKQSRDKKNGQGRYFGSMHKNVSKPGTRVSGVQDNIKVEIEESIGEYISLDCNGEGGECSNWVDEEMYISDSDPLDLQLVDLDDLIKPIRIMKMGDEMKNY